MKIIINGKKRKRTPDDAPAPRITLVKRYIDKREVWNSVSPLRVSDEIQMLALSKK